VGSSASLLHRAAPPKGYAHSIQLCFSYRYGSDLFDFAPGFLGQDPTASHCDDQGAELFGGPGLNGYPLQCGRLESQQFNNLDTWFPIAAVNRLDLAATDGSNCGQQRLVFANNQLIGNGRMLMIIEAQVPNPNPACGVDACLPVAELWASVGATSDLSQALRNEFLPHRRQVMELSRDVSRLRPTTPRALSERRSGRPARSRRARSGRDARRPERASEDARRSALGAACALNGTRADRRRIP